MLGVGGAVDAGVVVIVHQFAHVSFDGHKIRNGAVVHDGVTAEHEWVVVNRGDGCRCRGSDVSEDSFASGVGTDALEVEIMERWLRVFVKCWTLALAIIEFFLC